MRWTVFVTGVLAVGFLLLVLASRFGTDPSLVRSALLGDAAPAFDLEELDGGRVRSADLAGRLYVVNFWASWCVPCRQEAPHLQSFHERWSTRGVEVVGIVWNDTRGDAREFRRQFGLSFPQALDPTGRTAIDFGVFGIPETYLIDAEGIVRAKLTGAIGPGSLDEAMDAVLEGSTYTRKNDDGYQTQR